MAVVAAFGHIEITTCEFQWRVGLYGSDGWDVRTNQKRRYDLKERGYDNRGNHPNRKGDRQAFPATMPKRLGPLIDPSSRVGNRDEFGCRSCFVNVSTSEFRCGVDGYFVGRWAGCPGHYKVDEHENCTDEE